MERQLLVAAPQMWRSEGDPRLGSSHNAVLSIMVIMESFP